MGHVLDEHVHAESAAGAPCTAPDASPASRRRWINPHETMTMLWAHAVPEQRRGAPSPGGPNTISSTGGRRMDANPVNIYQYEEIAKEKLGLGEYDFIAGAATDEITLRRT